MADGKVVTQTKSMVRAKRLLKAHLAGLNQIEKEEVASGLSFSVADRFEFVEALSSMVATGKSPSAIITGEGGIGKTFTVMKTLRSLHRPTRAPTTCRPPRSSRWSRATARRWLCTARSTRTAIGSSCSTTATAS
jgi:hypothetical protein